MQILFLAKSGTHVKKGDLIVQLDPSEQEYNLEQSKSQLEEAEQQIIKVKADQAVKAAGSDPRSDGQTQRDSWETDDIRNDPVIEINPGHGQHGEEEARPDHRARGRRRGAGRSPDTARPE